MNYSSALSDVCVCSIDVGLWKEVLTRDYIVDQYRTDSSLIEYQPDGVIDSVPSAKLEELSGCQWTNQDCLLFLSCYFFVALVDTYSDETLKK